MLRGFSRSLGASRFVLKTWSKAASGLTPITANRYLCISEEVSQAVAQGQPVVALESTLLTHGLPPDRAFTAGRNIEQIIRDIGAIPATIAIFDQKLRVGLSEAELARLIDASSNGKAKKASIRDIASALVSKSDFVYGTTVSGTSYAAHQAGIRIFATGGTGGVHIEGETTLDISSDLTSLATIPVAVVSAGVKSILDIPRTLEVLESKGVTVTSVGTNIFPAFFTRDSGVKCQSRVDTPKEAAELLSTSLAIRPNSGLLFAVPIPMEMQAVGETITKAIATAFQELKAANISGSAVTPFLLERVRNLTGDMSLQANISLVENNASFAAKMAVSLSKLEQPVSRDLPEIAVIGGSNLDTIIRMQSPQLKTTQDITPPSSFPGVVETVGGGGVGRNLAETVARLSVPHVFITALAEDISGKSLLERYPNIGWDLMPKLSNSSRTANYVGVVNSTGELLFGVADMDIHSQISPSFVEKELSKLMTNSDVQLKAICMDANVTVATIRHIIATAKNFSIPVWYEPTDLHKCTKLLEATSQPIAVISPNLNELRAIYKKRGHTAEYQFSEASREGLQEISKAIRYNLLGVADNWLIKMGQKGVLFVNQKEALHFTSPVVDQESIVNVSGAGDTCAATVLYLRYIKHWTWKKAIIGGLKAVELSLASKSAIPPNLNREYFERPHELEAWSKKITVDDL